MSAPADLWERLRADLDTAPIPDPIRPHAPVTGHLPPYDDLTRLQRTTWRDWCARRDTEAARAALYLTSGDFR